MTEEEAVNRLKQGDISGLEALVKMYQVKAVRTATLITQNRALAEDIVQEAFLRVYARIGQFDAGRPFQPWFLRIVANDALKALRRQRREVLPDESAPLAETLADPEPGPVKRLEAAETREEVRRALKELPDAQRAAIVMRYFLGMSEADMAEAMDSPAGTVKWRLHAARNRLRTMLGPQVEDEESGG